MTTSQVGAGRTRLGEGNDVIAGEAGNDRIEGGAGDDTLGGDDGDDVIDGGEGDDRIDGGAGDDLLLDGTGEDLVFAGIGNDTLVVTLAAEADTYDGGAGSDTLDYSAASEALVIDLVAGTASGLEIGEDTISGFETIVGGSGDDHFVVGDAAMVLVGGAGENEFEFSFESTSGQSYSVMHEIMDFKVGDMIRMSKYDIFEEVLDEVGDQLAEVYGERVEANETPIRYRHEKGGRGRPDLDRSRFRQGRHLRDDYRAARPPRAGHRRACVRRGAFK